MADLIDGDIAFMRGKNPNTTEIADGEIFRSREANEPRRESIFVWSDTAYVGPLYNSGAPHWEILESVDVV